jgi:hypothetical protein
MLRKTRIWTVTFLGVLLIISGTVRVQKTLAASATLSTLAGFDAVATTPNGVLATVNAATCRNYAQPANCASVPNCVPIALGQNPATGLGQFNSCTIYTLNGAGEQAWAQDQLNYAQVAAFNQYAAAQNLSFCAAWKAATGPQQAQALTDLGASSGLVPPCQ